LSQRRGDWPMVSPASRSPVLCPVSGQWTAHGHRQFALCQSVGQGIDWPTWHRGLEGVFSATYPAGTAGKTSLSGRQDQRRTSCCRE